MSKTDIAGIIAPVVGAAVLIIAHFLSPATMTEIMFWCGVIGGALVGVANRYASPPAKKAPLAPPPGLNTFLMATSLMGIIGAGALGCSALGPAVGPSSEVVMCVVIRGLAGETVSQISKDCQGTAEQAVVDILNGLLAKDLSLPPSDAGRAMGAHALTPLQRATLAVTLNAYDSDRKPH